MSKPKATDKFQLVTDKIIALIEQGVPPWRKPWHSTPYQNLLTGHHYGGINPILCTIDMMLYHYEQPFFVGFAQAKERGWSVKKGSKSTWIRWGGTAVKETEEPETGETKTEYVTAGKWMSVFNVACLDDSQSERKISDLEEIRFAVRLQELSPTSPSKPESRLEAAESFIASHSPKTQFGGDKALYHLGTDTIRMPCHEDFSQAVAYYATYLHELVHWTGHPDRCHRPLNSQFGSQAYAFEELIAELGAAMVCNHLGINSDLENHASYLDSWLSLLKGDKKVFFQAAQKATQAANYLQGKDSQQ